MTLEQLAQIVRSDFRNLQESEIIGRIMLISGRGLIRSIQGYQMMVEKDLLPKGFIINFQTFALWVVKNPNLVLLFDRLELIPGKMKIGPKPEGFNMPEMLTREEALKTMNLPNPDF